MSRPRCWLCWVKMPYGPITRLRERTPDWIYRCGFWWHDKCWREAYTSGEVSKRCQ